VQTDEQGSPASRKTDRQLRATPRRCACSIYAGRPVFAAAPAAGNNKASDAPTIIELLEVRELILDSGRNVRETAALVEAIDKLSQAAGGFDRLKACLDTIMRIAD
jgi:hypothetical protein